MWITGLASIGNSPSDSSGTTITGSGTANTKSAYVQLTASTPWDAWGFIFRVIYKTSQSVNADFLFDVAIGGSGSETVIVANIPTGAASTRGNFSERLFPIEIAAGSRISVRAQQSSTSTTEILGVSILLLKKGDFDGATSCQTYGADTGDSGGVSVDPGGTANTKGAYSEITPSTSAVANWMVVSIGNQVNAVRTSANWLLDIAIGAASSETVIVPDIPLGTSSATDCFLGGSVMIPVPEIAIGTRIAARSQCTIIDAADRLFDVVIHLLYIPEPVGSPGGGGGEVSHVFVG